MPPHSAAQGSRPTQWLSSGVSALLQVPGRQLAASQTFTGCLIFPRPVSVLVLLGWVLVESRKPKRGEDRAAGKPSQVCAVGRMGEGGGSCTLWDSFQEGWGLGSSVLLESLSSRREMSTASHWAQIHYRVTSRSDQVPPSFGCLCSCKAL